MRHRPDIEEVMGRTQAFCGSDKPGTLIQVKDIRSIKATPIKPLNHWKFPEDVYTYLDEHIERLSHIWSNRLQIKDDFIPSLTPKFGIAEHSAYVGGEVDFSEETSWHHPIVKEWSDLNYLVLDNNNIWLKMVIDGLAYLKEKSENRFAVKLRGGFSPLDLANALRGNDLFYDFYDYPDELHELMKFCTKAVKWSLEHQHKVLGDFYGGVLSGFDIWMPGNATGHLSEDASALCSPEVFASFGLNYTKELIADYDHVLMHTHPLGKHNIPNIASIKQIDYIEITKDPNCERPIEIYKELKDVLLNKTITLSMNIDEIKSNLDFLKERKSIIVYVAEDEQEAQAAIKLVRDELSLK